MNYDEVPADLVDRYHIVTNFGTTQHVANQPQSFKIIHDQAAASALMLHALPASGTPNHGLCLTIRNSFGCSGAATATRLPS